MSKASFRSKDDEEAFIEDTDILLLATARNISIDGDVNDVDLHLQIPRHRSRICQFTMRICHQILPC